ncbi:membrane protein YfhO [Gillisia sp. Hel1_33_143]|uniref:YfhO family protein n=1 Tax=Gillisia sp. Hel1_33_143 TaxID=1336796 RepID=UPI0008797374|nr:YfhO family protein [Gillisia sp. Hel1_33_143]SDS63105.1 membrane protein YfhO [Gillisia sp. Hel1_33_143]
MFRSVKTILPHLLVFLGFIIISLAYFNPVLQGKEILQSDIAQYIGMSKQQKDFKTETGEETYWTDAAFGGMPTYQLGAYYPNNFIKDLDLALRFLPRPADYLFLYFLGFYILLLVLKLDYKLAFVGALAFGFSTYLIIILGVGHNAKAHAIAYMPMVLAGILLCFRSRYIAGFLLLAFAMALEIGANHFQMTYYLLILVVILGIAYLVDAFKKKQLPQYFKALGVMVLAVVLAIGANATNLMATQEYTEFSTRGDNGLTIGPDGSQKKASGLDFDYITEYSYGIAETFNLFIPRFMGGSSSEKLNEKSEMYQQLLKMGASPLQAKDFAESAPTYWGSQPFVGAPAYIGATIIFLFVFGLFLIKGRLKWWIVGGTVLALMLSWGKNFEFLTQFFIEIVPLYNKFRAVSSIQILVELCVPVLAIFGLYRLFNDFEKKEEKEHALKWATIITGGIALIFLLFKSMLFNFSGGSDNVYIQQMGAEFVRALKDDRKSIFTSDTIRSLIFVLLSAGFIWAYLKEKASKNLIILGFAVLILADLVIVDRRYVNNENFVASRVVNEPFQKRQADADILHDNSRFRVFDVSESPFNSARTSYFHNSIGGYHAAKPARMQDLFDFYIANNNMKILNMLNVKYFIVPTEAQPVAQENPGAFGNAWFVNDVSWVETANQEIIALGDTDLTNTAIIDTKFKDLVGTEELTTSDGSIQLKKNEPNELIYSFKSNDSQLVVFSEMYYAHGWKSFIDTKEVPNFRVDYILRGLKVPAGDHTITFKFEPEVIQTGGTISLISSILLFGLLLGGLFYGFKEKDFFKKQS